MPEKTKTASDKPDDLPSRCPACNSPWVFMHECICGDLPYPHIVCDACDTAFKSETLAEIAAKEVKDGNPV